MARTEPSDSTDSLVASQTNGRFASSMLGWVLLLVFLTACQRDSSRSDLVLIDGAVTVDDKPAAGITLTLHPIDGKGVYASGTTNDQGNLIVSTYDLGDGAVPGTYHVAFTWGEFDPVSRTITNDRLGGRYADAEESGVVWEIEPGSSFEARTIELKTMTSSSTTAIRLR